MIFAETMPDSAVLTAIDAASHRNEILIELPGRRRRRLGGHPAPFDPEGRAQVQRLGLPAA